MQAGYGELVGKNRNPALECAADDPGIPVILVTVADGKEVYLVGEPFAPRGRHADQSGLLPFEAPAGDQVHSDRHGRSAKDEAVVVELPQPYPLPHGG